ncbi:hypothetical protein [Anaeromyxobacter paludicola]|uniref:Uncharacterized protein n=1 Tax=Anaeromyxobacter paludicola TaxID=2918171 RepID=A0ABM7XDJ1_9BACT|nr:hypothetical protein [Anaeromyxobacter paludicola]BDG09877.1 hypothetical protein AMPC_29900 [Anaeromyxobacter paludicola]
MKIRRALLLVLLTAACGRSADPAGCAADSDCPAGQRCAPAPAGTCVPLASGDGGEPDGGASSDGGADAGAPPTDGGTDGGTTDGGTGQPDGGPRTCEPACGAGQVCTAALTCADAYTVAILSPADGALVGASLRLQVLVVRGNAEVAPPSVTFLASPVANGAVRMSLAGSDGLASSWTFELPIPNAVESPVTVTVVAQGPAGEQRRSITVQADAAGPRQTTVTAGCETDPCTPTSVVTVREQITDPHLVGAEAAISLDGYARVLPLAPSGDGYAVTFSLRDLPFPALRGPAIVRVTARDSLGNASVLDNWVWVDRLAWQRQLGAPVTTPAILPDGSLVAGLAGTVRQLVGLWPDGTDRWLLSLGVDPALRGGFVTAPPSVGASAIWVGSEDGRVYAVDLAGTKILNGVEGARGCDTGGPVKGSPALTYGGAELAFTTSSDGVFTAVDKAIKCAPSGVTDPLVSGPSIDGNDHVIGVTSGGTLYREEFSAGFRVLGAVASLYEARAECAVNAAGTSWVPGTDGTLYGVSVSGSVVRQTVGSPITSSPVVAANGDIIFGDEAGVLHRYTPAGVKVWATEPSLGAPLRAPLLLSGGDADILVTTADGRLVAVTGAGTVLWSGALAPGQDLREGNVYTAPGQSGRILSTAYFGCSDGNLYAVTVDGQLDPASPWPRAHHDAQNTGNARGPRP